MTDLNCLSPWHVRLIGAPTDSHSSFLRGAAAGPRLIRASLNSSQGNSACASGVEIGEEIRLEDTGDLPLDESSGDFGRLYEAAAATACAGAMPLMIGGDHMITYPVVAHRERRGTGEYPPFRRSS
jgi:arginase